MLKTINNKKNVILLILKVTISSRITLLLCYSSPCLTGDWCSVPEDDKLVRCLCYEVTYQERSPNVSLEILLNELWRSVTADRDQSHVVERAGEKPPVATLKYFKADYSNSRYNMFSTKTLHHIPAEPLDGVLHVGVCVRVVDRLVVGLGHHLAHDAVVIGSTCGLTQSYFPETARMTQKI